MAVYSLVLQAAVLGNLACLASSVAQAGVSVTLTIPPSGSVDPVSGKITGLAAPASNYKGILLVSSGDNMDLWWDKSHSRYLNLGVPDPGDAQNAGVVLSADFTFNWDNWASAPAQDGVARGFRFFVMPQSFDMRWPQYQIEGIPIPQNVLDAAVAEGFAVRSGAQLSPVLQQPAGGTAPVATQTPSTGTGSGTTGGGTGNGTGAGSTGSGGSTDTGGGTTPANPGGISNIYTPGGSGDGSASSSSSSSSGGGGGSNKGMVIGLSIFGVLVALATIATIGILYRRHKAQKAAQGGAYRRVEGSHLGPGTTGPENRDPTWQTSMPNLSAERGSARVTPK